jgi:hypothetical protein
MQDGEAVPAEAAGEWLRTKRPEISIRWDAAEEHDEDAYRRLLKLLFSPRAESGSA